MIPADLKRRPFTLDEARAVGVTRRVLAGKSWRRIGSSIYCWAELKEDHWQLLQAWHRRLPCVVFIGLTAAWLHRLTTDPSYPIDVAVPVTSGIRSRPGLVVHRRTIRDVVDIRGLPATSVRRTLSDLRRGLPPVEVLVLADEAMRLGLGRFDALAEPAESPMETRLRWLLMRAGLPRPEVQKNLHDAAGRFVGRADLFYPAARLVIAYDRTNHRDRLIEDNRRQNLVLNAGYRLLRFTAADLMQRPESIVALVRATMTPP